MMLMNTPRHGAADRRHVGRLPQPCSIPRPERQSCDDLRFCAAVSAAGALWPAARQFSPAPSDVKGKEGKQRQEEELQVQRQ